MRIHSVGALSIKIDNNNMRIIDFYGFKYNFCYASIMKLNYIRMLRYCIFFMSALWGC